MAGLAIPAIPGFTKSWLSVLAWSVDQAKVKLEVYRPMLQHTPAHSSITTLEAQLCRLSELRDDVEGKWDKNDLGDSIAVVIAGRRVLIERNQTTALALSSQTIAAALILASYRFTKHPDWAVKINDGITQNSSRDPVALQSMTLLKAFINESLRLHPPVPSAGLKNIPPEGVMVVESCSKRPDDFLPERWCTEPNLFNNSAAFWPFGLGQYGCVGKHLALLEIRRVLTEILEEYTISFAPKKDCYVVFQQL
ncbi:MAG: hypothetical protein Q9188_002125 [Gyalolechia gomerana]